MAVPRFESPPCPWASQVTEHVRGELRGARARSFLRHLGRCPDCRADVSDLEGLVGDMHDEMRSPEFHRAFSPGPEMEAQILSRMSEELGVSWWRHRSWLSAAAAVLIVAAGVGVALWSRGPRSPLEDRVGVELPSGIPDEPEPEFTEPMAVPQVDPQGVALRQAEGWLLAAQEASGAWNPERWGGRSTFEVGTTALVVLALSESPRADATGAVSRAVQFLLGSQGSDGRFGPDFVHAPYNHGLAALALLRSAASPGSTVAPKVQTALDAAVRYLVRTQLPGGGWGQWIGGRPAPSEALTIWPLEALVAARSRGWNGLDAVIRRAQGWLEGAASAVPDRVAPGLGAASQLASTTTADHRGAIPDWRGVRYLLHAPWAPRERAPGLTRLDDVRDLLRTQVSRGPLAGTWDPADGWGPAGGRIQSTALGALVLGAPPRAAASRVHQG